MCFGIAFTLVPKSPCNCIVRKWINHGIVCLSTFIRPPIKWRNFICCITKSRIIGYYISRRPDFRRCPSPITIDQPYRKPSCTLYLFSKKIPNRTKMQHVFRITHYPTRRYIVLRCRRSGFRHIKKPDVFIVCIGRLFF